MVNIKLNTVTVYTKCGDNPLVFADSASAKYGTQVLNQLEWHKDIRAFANGANGGEFIDVFIPYASVCYAVIASTSSVYTAPEDEMCK